MREDYADWDETYMGMAALMARRSKDPSTQVGAFIIDSLYRPVAGGYNGFPRDVDNSKFPWARDGQWLDTKYPYMCHAEANAIDNRGANSLDGCKIYVTLFPCNECAKRIIQNGIIEVIYADDKYAGHDHHVASKKLLNAAGVKYRQYKPKEDIILEFSSDEK